MAPKRKQPKQGKPMQARMRVRTGFDDETDTDLMVYMSMGNEDPVAAENAWAEFYQRHVDYLYAVCYRAYGAILGGETGVGDIVSDTFRRAYRSAHLFNADGIDDQERLRRRTRAWLGRIAQRLVQDTIRRRQRLDVIQLDQDTLQQIPDLRETASADNELVQKVRDALKHLSEKEQTVVRVTVQWYQPGKTHQRLPNDVVAELADTLKTTPENLRQIRRRAFNRIRDFLTSPPMEKEL